MPKPGKKSLKATLSSQQARLKRNKKVAEAAQVKEKTSLGNHGKTKGKRKVLPRKSTMPFTAQDKILLIGEGNFSYAMALFKHPDLQFLPAESVTATSYDSEDECRQKYPEAGAHLDNLKRRGVEILFNVDATALERCKSLKGRCWDRIVWNFPHAGKGIADMDRNIVSNQVLLVGFFRSAASLLTSGPIPTRNKKKRKVASDSDDEEAVVDVDYESDVQSNDEDMVCDNTPKRRSERGTILVTLRNVSPYTEWNLTQLAKKPPPSMLVGKPNSQYLQLRSFVFRRSDWDGYEHRMTKGVRAHGAGTTGIGGEDRTWEFCLKDGQ